MSPGVLASTPKIHRAFFTVLFIQHVRAGRQARREQSGIKILKGDQQGSSHKAK
jgi:hypothetical protein